MAGMTEPQCLDTKLAFWKIPVAQFCKSDHMMYVNNQWVLKISALLATLVSLVKWLSPRPLCECVTCRYAIHNAGVAVTLKKVHCVIGMGRMALKCC